jgi:hypothetical protein
MLIILCQNDGTGETNMANYYCQVRVNETVIASGRVENHDRATGWRSLIEKVIKETKDVQ